MGSKAATLSLVYASIAPGHAPASRSSTSRLPSAASSGRRAVAIMAAMPNAARQWASSPPRDDDEEGAADERQRPCSCCAEGDQQRAGDRQRQAPTQPGGRLRVRPLEHGRQQYRQRAEGGETDEAERVGVEMEEAARRPARCRKRSDRHRRQRQDQQQQRAAYQRQPGWWRAEVGGHDARSSRAAPASAEDPALAAGCSAHARQPAGDAVTTTRPTAWAAKGNAATSRCGPPVRVRTGTNAAWRRR